MKNNSKKGFTILELLAAVVIVGIIISLAVVVINKYILQGRNAVDNQIEKQLILAAKSYYTDNKTKFITSDDNVIVWYTTLKAEDYITNALVDSNGNSCAKSYVVVKKDNTKYSYSGCVLCDNNGYNNTKGKKECSESLRNNIYCEWTDVNGNKLDKTYLGVKKNNQVTLKLTCKGRGIKFNGYSSLDVGNMISSKFGNLYRSYYNTTTNNKNEITSFVSNIKYTTLPNADGKGSVSFKENSAYVMDNVGQKIPNVATVYDGIIIDGKGPSCTLSGPYKDSSLKTSIKAVKSGTTVYYGLNCKDDNNVNGTIEKSGFSSSDSISELNIISRPKNESKEKSAIISVKVTKGSSSKLKLTYKKDQLHDNYDNGNDETTSSVDGKASELVIDDQAPTCTFNGPSENALFEVRKRTLNIVDNHPNDYVYYELKCTDENGIDLSTFRFSDIKNNGFSRIEQSGDILPVKNNDIIIGYKYYIKAYENPNVVANTTKATLKYNESNLSDSVGNKGQRNIESDPVIMIDNNAIPSCNITYSSNNDGTGRLTGVMNDNIGLTGYTWSTSVNEPNPSDYTSISGTSRTVYDNVYKTGTYYLHMINELGLPGYCQIEGGRIVINQPKNPKIEASDEISSGAWHRQNYTLTAKDSNSGVTYYLGTSNYSIPSGATKQVNYNTNGTTYYAKACWTRNTNVCSDTVQYEALLDKTPPTCELTMRKFSGYLNNGNIPYGNDEGEYKDGYWTQYGVKVSMTCSDNNGGSGIKKRQITKPGGRDDLERWTAITSAEGDGVHTVTATAEDVAGNTFTKSVTVKRDTQPPVLTLSIAPSTSGKKLCKNLKVTVTCTDKLSGISAMTAKNNPTQATSKDETLRDAEGGTGNSTMTRTVDFSSSSGSRYLRAGCQDGAKNGTWTGDSYSTSAYFKIPRNTEEKYVQSRYCTDDDETTCESRIKEITYGRATANYYWSTEKSYSSKDNVISKTALAWCNDKKGTSYSSCGSASASNYHTYCLDASGANGKRASCTVKYCRVYYTNHREIDYTYKQPGYCTDTSSSSRTSETYISCESGYAKRTSCVY